MRLLSGWGNYPQNNVRIHKPSSQDELSEIITTNHKVIAYGNGRSYGDSALQNDVIDVKNFNSIIHLSEDEAYLLAEGGILLKEILEYIIPKGFLLYVLPGTQYVTLGGAIAADIHGKDHPSAGSFSKHLCGIWLLNVEGEELHCSKEINPQLFWNTCGGLGKTGIIVKAKVKLKKIESQNMVMKTMVYSNLHKLFQAFELINGYPYKVAWLDLVSKDFSAVLNIGKISDNGSVSVPIKNNSKPLLKLNWNLPFYMPSWFMNIYPIKVFNKIYFLKHKLFQGEKIAGIVDFFFILDKVNNWNKLYGRKGFLQYQFVLPEKTALEGIQEILSYLAKNKFWPSLAVLKRMGEVNDLAINSFPMPGYTMALDFKYGKNIFLILDHLDELVISYGGRIYLAKDARLKSESFRKMYPKSKFTNDKFISHQIERLSNDQ